MRAEVLLDSLNSEALTIIAILVYIIVLLAAAVRLFSRIVWSISRQGALPFAVWLAKANNRLELPVNAILSSSVLVGAMGAILLGYTTAINAILGGGIVMCYLSYVLAVGSLLYSGRAKVFQSERCFNLGRSGIFFNIISIIWMPFNTVWLCFPSYLPATGSTMNYASAVIGGVFL